MPTPANRQPPTCRAPMVKLAGLKRALQLLAIAALTILFLWLFLRKADLREVGRHSGEDGSAAS